MNNSPGSSARCGKDLILATRNFARESRSQSWLHTIVTLLCLGSVMTLTVLVPVFALKVLLSVLTALLLVRMFIIYHDYQHHTILKGSFPAFVIMGLFGYFILSPSSIWKRSHNHHHKNNSKLFGASIGSYPIATTEKFFAMNPKQRFAYLAVRHPLTIALAYFTMFLFGMCISSFTSSPRKHYDGLFAPVLHLILSATLFILLGWQNWLCLLFLPFLISHAIGAYLFYAQHNFPGVHFACGKEWAYEQAALESSSYMFMNPLMQWFTGNIGYHHIHHLNAKIPFYRLPEAMRMIPELQQCKRTSLNPGEIAACLRLKCWDPEKSRMVTISEMR